MSNNGKDEKNKAEGNSNTAETCRELENYYAIYYVSLWYIGLVVKKITNSTVEIKFLKEDLETFTWPKKNRKVINKIYLFYLPIQMEGCHPFKLNIFDRSKINTIYKCIKKIFNYISKINKFIKYLKNVILSFLIAIFD